MGPRDGRCGLGFSSAAIFEICLANLFLLHAPSTPVVLSWAEGRALPGNPKAELLRSEDLSDLELIVEDPVLHLILQGRNLSLFRSDVSGRRCGVRKKSSQLILLVQEVISQASYLSQVAVLNGFYLLDLLLCQVEVFRTPAGRTLFASLFGHERLSLRRKSADRKH